MMLRHLNVLLEIQLMHFDYSQIAINKQKISSVDMNHYIIVISITEYEFK